MKTCSLSLSLSLLALLTGFAQGDDWTVHGQSGTSSIDVTASDGTVLKTLGVAVAKTAPTSGTSSASFGIDWTFSVVVSGTVGHQPTATGSVTIVLSNLVNAGAASHANTSAQANSSADTATTSAASSGAQPPDNHSDSTTANYTVFGSSLSWAFDSTTGMWTGSRAFHSTSGSASATATASIGSKGSSATADATAGLSGPDVTYGLTIS